MRRRTRRIHDCRVRHRRADAGRRFLRVGGPDGNVCGPVIDLRNISKAFDGKVAVRADEFVVRRGRTVVLIGPSGSGKSTLLRLMVGLLDPEEGTIHFGDEPVTRATVRALRRRMGYVIQEGGLFPHLTARGNTTLMARHVGWSAERANGRLADLVELTRFPADALDRFPRELSGGQRQRVSLMRALMLDPDVLFLDEPLGALDPMIRAGLQDELREIFRRLGKTVVMVTHDLAEARHFADEIVLLHEGRIVQQGRFEELRDAPAEPFVTEFLRAHRGLAT
ncbi:ATP-binding cassette domain-containing protein [bacterium]|nr:ATP-binding cassette domain-containing protein [bacterium]